MITTAPFLTTLLACPMCMSGASGQTLLAANNAILLMLVCLFSVLASFLSFIFYLARRARRIAAEDAALEEGAR